MSDLDEKYCCDGFRNCVGEAGKRGLAIVVVSDPDGIVRFILQSRGCDYGAIAQMTAFAASLPDDLRKAAPRVNIVEETGLRYCPWCGAKLQDVAARDEAAFRSQALAMKYLRQDLSGSC